VASSPIIANLREQETQLLRQEAELKTLYGEKHPRMVHLLNEKQSLQQKIRAEANRLIQVLENEVRIAQTRVSSIDGQLSGLKKGSTTDRAAEVKLRELERNARRAAPSTSSSCSASRRPGSSRRSSRPTPAS
jgi:uncharacterized protein involved in exopolysaccharide biosynthesis